MKLRIAEHVWTDLCRQLLARNDVESAGLLLGDPLKTAGGSLVIVRETIVAPDSAYRIRRRDQISLDPIALNQLTRRARDRRWSVFTIHTHPGAQEPWFSAADDVGDARLMPSMKCQIPDAPHGSIVLVDDGSALARVFDENAESKVIDLQVVGRTLKLSNPSKATEEAWFARQVLALGARGQGELRRLRVAVVGLGGIGSLVSLQLAHLGVGELILLDGDRIEPSNLSRIAGALTSDVGSYKVDVAARYAEALGLVGKVEPHREFVGLDHEGLLASCDVVVSCVDRQTPRAMLNRLAYRWLVPVIDLGTVFRVNAAGTIIADAGRVVTIGPGRPCLGCWGHLDPHALRIESLSEADRENEVRAGYIEGADELQPSVVAFNTFVAGAGIAELLRLVTAFAGADSPPLRLAFSFTEGTVRRNSLSGNPHCEICGNERLHTAANGETASVRWAQAK